MRIIFLFFVSSFILTQHLYSQCGYPEYNGCTVIITCDDEDEPVVWDMGDGTRIIAVGGVSHTYSQGGSYHVVASDGSFDEHVYPSCTPTVDNSPPNICTDIIVFPNPTRLNATNVATIKFRFDDLRLNDPRFTYTYVVKTLLDQTITRGTSPTDTNIPLTRIAAGLYRLHVKCPNGRWKSKKFFVVRD